MEKKYIIIIIKLLFRGNDVELTTEYDRSEAYRGQWVENTLSDYNY